jgi:hypothetical protein
VSQVETFCSTICIFRESSCYLLSRSKFPFFILIGNFFLIFKLSVRREVQPTVTFSPFNGLSLPPDCLLGWENDGGRGVEMKKDEKTENSSKKNLFWILFGIYCRIVLFFGKSEWTGKRLHLMKTKNVGRIKTIVFLFARC